MICVTRLSGQKFIINAEQIRTVESTPDTMITLVHGEKLVVAETMPEVVERAIEYGRSLRRLMPPS